MKPNSDDVFYAEFGRRSFTLFASALVGSLKDAWASPIQETNLVRKTRKARSTTTNTNATAPKRRGRPPKAATSIQ